MIYIIYKWLYHCAVPIQVHFSDLFQQILQELAKRKAIPVETRKLTRRLIYSTCIFNRFISFFWNFTCSTTIKWNSSEKRIQYCFQIFNFSSYKCKANKAPHATQVFPQQRIKGFPIHFHFLRNH